jgi:hypothetical protein
MLYQYAVIARNYVLFPPILFLIAHIYFAKLVKPYQYTALLFLLSNISAHGFIISGVFFLLFIFEAIFSWDNISAPQKNKILISILLLTLSFMAIIYYIIPVPPDKIPHRSFELSVFHITSIAKSLINNLTPYNLVSFSLIFIILLWFISVDTIQLFLILFAPLIIFIALTNLKGWHEGIPFFLLLCILWISFKKKIKNNFYVYKNFKYIICTSITIILVFHVSWGISSSVNDFFYNYSASKDVANYLKKNNLTEKKIAVTSFHAISILPYFDKNIFMNHNYGKLPAFFSWSAENNPLIQQGLDGLSNNLAPNIDPILEEKPDIIIIGIKFHYQNSFQPLPGYRIKAKFKGQLFWKDRIYEKDSFIIFEKKAA